MHHPGSDTLNVSKRSSICVRCLQLRLGRAAAASPSARAGGAGLLAGRRPAPRGRRQRAGGGGGAAAGVGSGEGLVGGGRHAVWADQAHKARPLTAHAVILGWFSLSVGAGVLQLLLQRRPSI